jgi:hypothetical protein
MRTPCGLTRHTPKSWRITTNDEILIKEVEPFDVMLLLCTQDSARFSIKQE